jgi:hypothetical protein
VSPDAEWKDVTADQRLGLSEVNIVAPEESVTLMVVSWLGVPGTRTTGKPRAWMKKYLVGLNAPDSVEAVVLVRRGA